jgi:hypothetical protein
MTGKLEWLNESAYRWGRWTAAIPQVIEQSEEVSFTATEGRDICIHEIDRSGSVLLSSVEPDPRPLMGYGDAEVFLTIVSRLASRRIFPVPSTPPSGSTG